MVTFQAWNPIDMFVFRFVAIRPFLAEIHQFPCLTLKIQGQGHGQGQIKCSHFRTWVKSIHVLFVSWQSDHFWLRYSKFYVWPWKFKVKVMIKVKSNAPISGLMTNRYVCFSFCDNRTIFGREMACSMFDLENSRSRSWSRSNQMLPF